MATKLSRASVKLYQVRDYVNDGILKIIYYALFESHIHYRCMIWIKNVCIIDRLFIFQKNALRLICFKERNAHTAISF